MKLNKPGYRIREIFIVVSVDEDGDEGICAMGPVGGMWIPMLTSDEGKVAAFVAEVKKRVKVGDIKSFKVLKFSNPKRIVET